MRYAFVKLKNPATGTFVFMESREFDRYSHKDLFRETAVSLIILDNIHIGCFPLLFKYDEIIYYNPDVSVHVEMSLSDIAFRNNRPVSMVASLFNCDNLEDIEVGN